MKRSRILTVLVTVALTAGAATAVAQGNDEKPVPEPKPRAVEAAAAAHTQHIGDPVTVGAGQFRFAQVTCPAGTVPTGGGGSTSGTTLFFTDSYASGNLWLVGGKNTGTSDVVLRARAVCTVP
ncbi:hypothetical protein [Streptomyces sp. SAJ15]|uniref:hypothetical protein n=1 Tax=Streptomyces sp. SAJ15 TaxID=2011095 RepID=UPI00118615E8|nr:hypothetical protein [Streptomyces sp. SAJ15]TVL91026.1 hypothetical protein CD790_17080 [Streptomyces sp. SAJ15]